jgi:hypothetical protein
MLSVPPMCWALGSGFVSARPASESPELLELDEDPELPLELPELPELPELELPQAATATAHTAATAASRIAPAVLRVIFSIVRNLPRTIFPVGRVSAGAITSR